MGKKKKKSHVRTKLSSARNGEIDNDNRKLLTLFGVAFVVAVAAFFLSPSPPPSSPQAGMGKGNSSALVFVGCSENSYLPAVEGCTPTQCFREYVGGFANEREVSDLIQLAEEGMKVGGGGAGSVSIFDTASGACSHGEQFVNAYEVLKSQGKSLNDSLLRTFQAVIDRVGSTIAKKRGLEVLYPASPTFFSRIEGGSKAVQINDEYWHAHVDTRQYGTFIYTSLLYLNTHGEDYKGGEFQFVNPGGDDEENDDIEGASSPIDAPSIIHPRSGSLLIFTSGEENPHRVLKVREGVRYAVTISWTCDESAANARRFS